MSMPRHLHLAAAVALATACAPKPPTAEADPAPDAFDASPLGTATPVEYGYDAANRLIAVYDAAGNSARYSYDAAGNLLQITRATITQLSIFSISPVNGPPGTVVTVTGSGFKTGNANNIVKFNGIAAAVTSATPLKLVATVPATGTTGPLTVTVGTAVATSPTPFTVTAPAPRITSFTPTSGDANTRVTITGTGFNTIPTANSVAIGGMFAQVLTATATTLTIVVPPDAVGGKIIVATTRGTATSTQDYFVVPITKQAAFFARMTVGGPNLVISLPQAEKAAVILFDAALQDVLALPMTGVDLGNPSAAVEISTRDPAGTWVYTNSATGNTVQHFPPIRSTNTHVIFITPFGNTRLNMTLALLRPIVGTLTVGAAPTQFTTTRAGQAGRYSFTAPGGRALTFSLLNGTFPSGVGAGVFDRYNVRVTPVLPTLETLEGRSQSVRLPTLAAGPYTVKMEPVGLGVGQVGMSLALEVTGSAGTVGGAATTLTLAAGQQGRYTFSGTANTFVSLGVSQLSTTPANWMVAAQVLNPNGSVLTDCNFSAPDHCNLPKLPTTGAYSLQIVPDAAAAASVSVLLSQALTGTLTAGGPAAIFATTRVGQNGRYSFTATAGTGMHLAVSGCTFPNGVTGQVLDPNGDSIRTFFAFPGSDSSVQLVGLPAATYTVVVDPTGAGVGQISLALGTQIVGSAGTVDGAVTSLTLTAGKHGRFTFPASTGQYLSVGFPTFNPNPVGEFVSVAVLAPDGSTLADCSTSSPSHCRLPRLTASGTYTLLVAPNPAVAVSFGVLISQDATGPITVGGPAVTFASTRVGKGARYQFTTTAVTTRQVLATGCTFPDGVSGSVLDSTGNTLGFFFASPGQNATADLPGLPAGTYTIALDPLAASTGQVSIALQ